MDSKKQQQQINFFKKVSKRTIEIVTEISRGFLDILVTEEPL